MSIAETGRNFLKNAAKYVAAPLLLITVACNQTETTPINMVNAQPSPAPRSGKAEKHPTPTPGRKFVTTPVTSTHVPESITKATPTVLSFPTAEKKPSVPGVFGVGISEKLLAMFPPKDFAFLEKRIRMLFLLFPCDNPNLGGFKLYPDGKRLPGNEPLDEIYIDPDRILRSVDALKQNGTPLNAGQIIASDVLPEMAMRCTGTDADKTEGEIRILFNNNYQAIVGPGLRVTIIDPDGNEHPRNHILEGVATGLTIFSFGINQPPDTKHSTPDPITYSTPEMFSTVNPLRYYTGVFTYAFLSDVADAQMVNEFKNNGDFKGFTAFIMGIDKTKVTANDMAIVIDWYFRAAGTKTQDEFDTFIEEVDKVRQKRQKEETSQNIQPDTIEGLTHQLATIKYQRRAEKLNQKQAAGARKKLRKRIWIEKRAQVIRNESRSKEQTHDWLKWMKDKYGAQV